MEPFVGQIEIFAFEFAPSGWMVCNGQLLSIQEFPTLFQLIGTSYGGNGQSTFALPKIPPVVPNGPGYYISVFGQAPKK
jgi:microcystin-dependent protein